MEAQPVIQSEPGISPLDARPVVMVHGTPGRLVIVRTGPNRQQRRRLIKELLHGAKTRDVVKKAKMMKRDRAARA